MINTWKKCQNCGHKVNVKDNIQKVFDDIEKLSRPLAGDFGETPIYKEYQELKKSHLSTFQKEKEHNDR